MTANGEVRRCSGWAYMTSESLGVHRNIERRTGATQRGSSPMGGGTWQRRRNGMVTLRLTGNSVDGSTSCALMWSFSRTCAWREMGSDGSSPRQAAMGKNGGPWRLLTRGGNRWRGPCTNGLGSPFKDARVEGLTWAIGRAVLRRRYGRCKRQCGWHGTRGATVG
jgi:hypothetical protein